MNDFHLAVLWVRSFELVVGRCRRPMLTERELTDLFLRYRSPFKA